MLNSKSFRFLTFKLQHFSVSRFYLRIKTPPIASIIPEVNLIFFLAPGVDPSWVQDMPVRKITAPIVPRIRERTQNNLATTKIQNESFKIIYK